MPLYRYGCPTCDVIVEELRSMELADFPPVECPVCHGLCEREVATVHVLTARGGAHSSSDHHLPPEATALTFPHLPGCPCCSGRR